MTPRVFLTGGSGFAGRRLIDVLVRQGSPLVLLDRSGKLGHLTTADGAITTVRADLLEPERYADALATADVIVHLAASTGRASAHEHSRTIAEGTAALLAASAAAGVERFLFVSSIAAKFPDQRGYPYAQAKLRAEASVRASGLRHTILRPTMVLGPGSPILAALEKLAGLPVIPIFGDGTTKVQPIHVDDLAEFIAAVLVDDRFRGETLEVGGTRTLSIEDLVQEIRMSKRATRGRALHLPMGAILGAVRVAEAVGLGPLLPLSTGQLATFRFDGTIENNALFESRRDSMHDVPAMVGAAVGA